MLSTCKHGMFHVFYCLYALLLDLMFDDLRGKRRMIYAIHRTVVYGDNSEILFYRSCWEFEIYIVLSKI